MFLTSDVIDAIADGETTVEGIGENGAYVDITREAPGLALFKLTDPVTEHSETFRIEVTRVD